MRRTILALTGVAGLALLVAQADARPRGGHGHPGDGAMRAAKAMLHGLDEDARAEARERLHGAKEGARATRKALHEANAQLAAQLLAPEAPSEAALAETVARIGTLRSQLLEQHVEAALALRAELTPAQLQAAGEALEEDAPCHREKR